MGCLACCEDRRLRNEAAAAARELGVLSNELAMRHPLNQPQPGASDPRSRRQVDAALALKQERQDAKASGLSRKAATGRTELDARALPGLRDALQTLRPFAHQFVIRCGSGYLKSEGGGLAEPATLWRLPIPAEYLWELQLDAPGGGTCPFPPRVAASTHPDVTDGVIPAAAAAPPPAGVSWAWRLQAAPQAALPPVMVPVVVPEGVAPGSAVQFQLPSGQQFQAPVPAGHAPGMTFMVQAPQTQAPAPPQPGPGFCDYAAADAAQIEAAWRRGGGKGVSTPILVAGASCIVDFDAMVQRAAASGEERSVQRSAPSWRWRQGERSRRYDAVDEAKIEAQWQAHGAAGGVSGPVTLSFARTAYVLDFAKMVQRNPQSGKERPIERAVVVLTAGTPQLVPEELAVSLALSSAGPLPVQIPTAPPAPPAAGGGGPSIPGHVPPASPEATDNTQPLVCQIRNALTGEQLVGVKTTTILRAEINRVKSTKRGPKQIHKPAKTRDFWVVRLEGAPGPGERSVSWKFDGKFLMLGATHSADTDCVLGWSKKRNRWEAEAEYKKDGTQWRVVPECWELLLLPKKLRAADHNSAFNVPQADMVHEELAAGPERQPSTAPGDQLLCYSTKLPHLLGTVPQEDWDHPNTRFAALCEFAGCPLVDRTGTLSNGLRMKILHPIPVWNPGFDTPLPDLMMQRAQSLLQRGVEKGEELHVLWSGGIDTTAVVVAFLRLAKDGAPGADKVVIRYCERSVREYPLFWDRFLLAQNGCPFRVQKIEGHVRDVVPQSGWFSEAAAGPPRVVVTGDPADMLMGTYIMQNAFQGRKTGGNYMNPLHFALDKPWREVMPLVMDTRGLLDGTPRKDPRPGHHADHARHNKWVAWMEPFVQRSPLPVATVFDFLWWMTYALKYTHDVMRIFYNRPEVGDAMFQSVINFYETEPFHQWSFSNHAEKMKDHRCWASYKLPQKAFIRDFTGDDEYYAAKVKLASARNSWGYEFAVDDRWHVIRFGKYSSSLRRLYEKYGDSLMRYAAPEYRIAQPSAPPLPSAAYCDHMTGAADGWTPGKGANDKAIMLGGAGLAGVVVGGAAYYYLSEDMHVQQRYAGGHSGCGGAGGCGGTGE